MDVSKEQRTAWANHLSNDALIDELREMADWFRIEGRTGSQAVIYKAISVIERADD